MRIPKLSVQYELTNHLGNVLAVISDKRRGVDANGDGIIDYYNPDVLSAQDYYAGGAVMPGRTFNSSAYNYSFNGQMKSDEISGAGNHTTALFWEYDTRLVRRWNLDPKPTIGISDYSVMNGNPILYSDVLGDKPEDWVKDKKGNVRWDKNANSQATTKAGETYLGKTLTFNFTSYIDKKSWDGPTLGGLVDPSGVKLNSTITLTGRENASGELTSLVGTSFTHPGETPMGTPRDYYPGKGGSNNVFDLKRTSKGINLNFEQHTSVSPSEELGLNTLGFKIVDVAQKLNINYTRSTGSLSVSSYTNVFPSATLMMNDRSIMQYSQPSFMGTHTAPTVGTSTPSSGSLPIRNFSYYPSQFYKR